ncbi:hypothetical protein GCM10009612_00670 [Streptomyces beijiangensis]
MTDTPSSRPSRARTPTGNTRKKGSANAMANTETALKEAMTSIEGTIGVALVDYTSGMALGTLGGGKDLDLSVAAAGNTDVVRAKVRTMELLGLKDEIEDILITLGGQYHLLRLLKSRGSNGLFLYIALDKSRANLAMARHQLKKIEKELEV